MEPIEKVVKGLQGQALSEMNPVLGGPINNEVLKGYLHAIRLINENFGKDYMTSELSKVDCKYFEDIWEKLPLKR